MPTDDEKRIDLESLLQEAGRDVMPPDVELRLRRRVQSMREWMDCSPASTSAVPSRRHWKGRLWIGGGVAGIALVVLVLLATGIIGNPTPNRAWAGVVENVESRPWMRCTTTRFDGTRMEIWFSPSTQHRTLAARFGDAEFVAYVDLGRGKQLSYRKRDGRIHRRNVSGPPGGVPFLGELAAAFSGYDRGVKQLYEDARLIEQTHREVEVDDRDWIEYELTFEETHGRRERFIDIYRVDVRTNLPRVWIRRSPDGRRSLTFQIDFPESGPGSIYDLGVPRSAPVIPHER